MCFPNPRAQSHPLGPFHTEVLEAELLVGYCCPGLGSSMISRMIHRESVFIRLSHRGDNWTSQACVFFCNSKIFRNFSLPE